MKSCLSNISIIFQEYCLGGVVGSSWNGISYIRSYAAKISNPRTDPQQDHRQKIAVTMKFLKPLKIFIRTGFKNYTKKMTAMNSAMSWNYHNALQGFYPNNTIDYSRALLAHGLLPLPQIRLPYPQ